MKYKYSLVLMIFIPVIFILSGCVKEEKGTRFSSLAVEQRIDSLIKIMTLDEKIGQMTLFTSDWDVTGPTMREGYTKDIKSGRCGAIFNAFSVKYTRHLQQLAVDSTRLHIPLLFGYDVIHGFKTIFPLPLAEACSWDTAAIEGAERIAAIEATAEGLHWTYAPMVDVARDPRWGRICEGAGEDPYLGSQIAIARVRGFQGNDLSANNTLMACAKHFAAYGAAEAGRDYNTVDVSERTLRDIYLPPFKAAIDAGVGTIMTSFNEISGIPSSANKWLLTEVLRDEWGFQGFVVTDYTSINELVPHGIAADDQQAGELALNAGVDMDMQGAVYYNYLAKSLKEGKVKQEQIDEAVRRILRMKFALGLFDDPYHYCNEEREKDLVMSSENLDAALEMAHKSIVLLKNENHLLPLSKETSRIALIGPLGDDKKDLIGSWSAAGDYTKCVSLLEGIQKKTAEQNVVQFIKGCEIEGDSVADFSEAISAAKKADVVIMAIGEGAWMSGEAASRSHINLPGMQQRLLEQIVATGKPVVVVLMNGRPLNLSWMDGHVQAILETWFLGTRAGDAIADVLFGDYNPSGKLTVSFPRDLGQVPIYYDHKNTGRPESASKYTSKYLDVPNSPLYPFGYGLSYTTFKYSNLRLDKAAIKMNEQVHVSVDVTNSGEIAGDEIVQLYVHDLVASVTRPVRELKGFRRINLKAGETKTVEFTIDPDELSFWGLDKKFVTEPGDFKVYVGPNSNATEEAGFILQK